MSKPIIDKAEVSIEFPDKFYHGTFGHMSRFDVKLDDNGVHISLDRSGEEHRHVAFHLHHMLFSGILEALSDKIAESGELSDINREQLQDAAEKLVHALKKSG